MVRLKSLLPGSCFLFPAAQIVFFFFFLFPTFAIMDSSVVVFVHVWRQLLSKSKLLESEVGSAHTYIVLVVEGNLVISWMAAVLIVCDVSCFCIQWMLPLWLPLHSNSQRAPIPLEHPLRCSDLSNWIYSSESAPRCQINHPAQRKQYFTHFTPEAC